MLTDREIIDKFHLQVSWANSCKIIELNGFMMTSSKYVLFMPCNWQDYEKRKHQVITLAEKAGYAPGLVIAGEPDKETLNTILYDPTLPETMVFQGRTMRFEMQIKFINPKIRAYLNKTILWEIEEPF